jgi:nucleoside-diphosphate-sugar epimerase
VEIKTIAMQNIFITGGTGYIGTRLIKALLKDGNFQIQALVRKGSEKKLPEGCEIVFGDALNAASYKNYIAPAAIFVHLIGVAHPSPSKREQFKNIDLVSIQQAVNAATHAAVNHFIYLSVAMYPTKIMKDFQEVRAKGEALLNQSKLKTSFIRPWYVLGPGHWWPVLLKPFYFIARLIPSKREAAQQLDTITIRQMINTLILATRHQPVKNCYYEVADMQKTRPTTGRAGDELFAGSAPNSAGWR